MAVFPIGMALSSRQHFAFKIWSRASKLDSWICGRLRVFAGVLRVILGAAVCIYMRWCSGYENGLVCHWDAAMMQAMFSRIQNVNCGDSVATGKQNQANYSRIRRDSENWVVLGHTPKLPKIIDRRNVQVEFEFRNFFGTPWLKVAGTRKKVPQPVWHRHASTVTGKETGARPRTCSQIFEIFHVLPVKKNFPSDDLCVCSPELKHWNIETVPRYSCCDKNGSSFWIQNFKFWSLIEACFGHTRQNICAVDFGGTATRNGSWKVLCIHIISVSNDLIVSDSDDWAWETRNSWCHCRGAAAIRLGSALSMFCCDAATVAYLCTGIHGQR